MAPTPPGLAQGGGKRPTRQGDPPLAKESKQGVADKLGGMDPAVAKARGVLGEAGCEVLKASGRKVHTQGWRTHRRYAKK